MTQQNQSPVVTDEELIAALRYLDDSISRPVSMLERKACGKAADRLEALTQASGIWYDGEPPKPFRTEWFIAETIYGDRIVLKALPEEWTYDYKTADETYIKAKNIKKWMQFPDSQFVPYVPSGKVSDEQVERAAKALWPSVSPTWEEAYNSPESSHNGYRVAHYLRQARKALEAAQLPARPVVKALKWRQIGPDGSDVVAETSIGDYTLSFGALSAGGDVNLWVAGADDDTFTTFYDRSEAKAAAQADYERRILSALEGERQ